MVIFFTGVNLWEIRLKQLANALGKKEKRERPCWRCEPNSMIAWNTPEGKIGAKGSSKREKKGKNKTEKGKDTVLSVRVRGSF